MSGKGNKERTFSIFKRKYRNGDEIKERKNINIVMKISPTSAPKLPSKLKLALTGSLVGPVVDSIHNQCLLEYHKGKIEIPITFTEPGLIIETSFFIPPLLALAYVVLGGLLPKLIGSIVPEESETVHFKNLKAKAILAISSTAIIVKISEYLQTHDISSLCAHPITFLSVSEINLVIMVIASVLQWVVLDRTVVSLITATIVSIGGPLSELPFIANDFWVYIPDAADYFPLHDLAFVPEDYRCLALSSITGPCYFAVTMDAIALARFFDSEEETLINR
jgi:hypothetical protein